MILHLFLPIWERCLFIQAIIYSRCGYRLTSQNEELFQVLLDGLSVSSSVADSLQPLKHPECLIN